MNRALLYAVIFMCAVVIGIQLPKTIMLYNYEYSIGTAPHATYSNPANGYNAVVRLHEDGYFICSAVVISEQYAVTAGHCVFNNNNLVKSSLMVVNEHGDSSVPVNVVAAYGLHDIAIVSGNFEQYNELPVDWNGHRLGSKKGMTCGYPQGQKDLLCSPYTVKGNAYFYIRGDGNIWQGMSGGPLIIDGHVIGVNSHVGIFSVMVGSLIGMQEMFTVFK